MENEINVENLTFGEKFKSFFVNPTKYFAYYKEKPKFFLTMSLITLVTIIYTIITFTVSKDSIIEVAKKAMEQQLNGQPVPEQVMNLYNSPFFMVTGTIGAAVGVVATLFIGGLIYYLVVRIFKGKAKIIEIISVYTHANIASTIGVIVKMIYTLITKKTVNLDAATLSAVLFSNIDIFVIWQLVLMVFGISAVACLSKKKSTVVVIIVFALTLAYAVAMFAFGQSVQNMQPKA
jgi:hypothetical protein